MRQVGVEKFGDLSNCPLRIVACDVDRQSPVVFSKENTPELAIADAVRMSVGIPLFFESKLHEGGRVGDGGLIANNPTWLFRDTERATLNFKLVSVAQKRREHKRLNAFQLFERMREMRQMSREKRNPPDVKVLIRTQGISLLRFKLNQTEKEQLFHAGYAACSEKLEEIVNIQIPM